MTRKDRAELDGKIAADLNNLQDLADIGTERERSRVWRQGQMLRTWRRNLSVASACLKGIDGRTTPFEAALPVLLGARTRITEAAAEFDAREDTWTVTDRTRRQQLSWALDILDGRVSVQWSPGGAILPGALIDAMTAQGGTIERGVPLSIERVRERLEELEQERAPHEARIAEVAAAFARGTGDS